MDNNYLAIVIGNWNMKSSVSKYFIPLLIALISIPTLFIENQIGQTDITVSTNDEDVE